MTTVEHPLPSTRSATATPARPSGRLRIQVSAALLIGGWSMAACSTPLIVNGSPLASVCDSVGWCSWFLGVAVRCWAIRHIAGRKGRTVVDTGPYALCRNPLYVGTLLLVVAEAAFLRSLWFTGASCALVFFYAHEVIPGEERKLLARLGTAYRAYFDRVPRWLPRFNRNCLLSVPVQDPAAIVAEAKCAVWWLGLPLLGAVACWLRELPEWPRFLPGF